MCFELKKGDKFMNLVNCQVSPADHKKRRINALDAGDQMLKSVQTFDFSKVDNIIAINEVPRIKPMAYMYQKVQFGAVGTVEKCGCACFTSYYILQKYSQSRISFEEWVNEIANKGYRFWRFSKYPDIKFSDSRVDPVKVKERFEGKVELSGRESQEMLEDILGKVEGVGSSAFLFDNLIADLGKVEAVQETRLTTVEQVIENLKNGFWVPMRVDNRLYSGDYRRSGTSYIILTGISKGTAFVFDPTEGACNLPFEILMKAVAIYPKHIGIWDLKSLKH